jgi:hypothetical protein
VDEVPDVSFYVMNEPFMTSPEPDDVGVWQELEQLRSENLAWRECVQGIWLDADRDHHASADGLKQAIRARLVHLAERVAQIHRRPA